MTAIREDVHIHAEAAAVYSLLAAPGSLDETLPELLRGPDASGGIRTPFRILRAEEPRLLTIAPGSEGGRTAPPDIESLHWDLQPEGRGEVHVTLAAGYRPAGGLTGPLLDLLLHRPRRRQALRDALWRLKRRVEGAPAP